jgi:DNA polymerase III subunit chi
VEVGFYHLTRSAVEDVLPKLLEKGLAAGHRIGVRCVDERQAKALDAHLWTWDERSFLPHGMDDADAQPILLGVGDAAAANGADLLVTLTGAPPTDGFRRVLHIFDDAGREAARAHWRALDAAGITRSYWQQGDAGWEKAA